MYYTIFTLGAENGESIEEQSEVPESKVDASASAGATEFDAFPSDAWTNFLNAKETQLML